MSYRIATKTWTTPVYLVGHSLKFVKRRRGPYGIAQFVCECGWKGGWMPSVAKAVADHRGHKLDLIERAAGEPGDADRRTDQTGDPDANER